MGLKEIKLDVSVQYPIGHMLRQLLGNRNARDVMEGSEFYQPEDALQSWWRAEKGDLQ